MLQNEYLLAKIGFDTRMFHFYTDLSHHLESIFPEASNKWSERQVKNFINYVFDTNLLEYSPARQPIHPTPGVQ